jgi:ribonuclease R
MAKLRAPKASRFASKATPKPTPGLPDRDTLIKFIREAGQTDKAEIAKSFGLKGADRKALREMLKELETSGALGKRGRRGLAEAGALPPVGVADVIERDNDGDLFVRLTKGEETPLVRLAPDRSEAARGWSSRPTTSRILPCLGP